MRKKQLLKSLLVAAALCVGASAWAQTETVTTYDFEDSSHPFQIHDPNRISLSVVDDADLGSKVLKATCGNMNSVAFAYYDFSDLVSASTTNVTAEYDFYIVNVAGHALISLADADLHTGANGGFTGKSNTGYGWNGSVFHMGCWRGGGANMFSINGTQNDLAGLGAWCHAKVAIDLASKKVEYTITDKAGDLLATASGVAYANAAAQTCSQIDFYIGTNQSGNAIMIDNLSITTVDDESIDVATYTINYNFEGTTIKTVTGEAAVGTIINADNTITVDDVKYYATDDATIEMELVSGENVLDVEMRKALTSTVNINAVDGEGNVLKTFSAERVEGNDGAPVFYTRVVEVDGQYYAVPAANGNGLNYGRNMKYGDEDINVEYTLDETINYYAEENGLNKSRDYAAQGMVPERASGGDWRRLSAKSQAWTAPLEAGIYTFEVSGRNQGSSEGSLDIAVRLKDGTFVETDKQFVVGSAINILGTFESISVPQDASIAIVNATDYNSNIAIDYAIARKTGEAATVDYTINYIFESNTIFSETSSSFEGTVINAKNPITVDDVKYYATDEATTSMTLVAGGDNTLDVEVRLALTGFVNINAVDADGNVLKIFSEERTEGDDAKTAFYTRAVEYNGQYYTVPAANANAVNYGRSMAYGAEDIDVVYTLDETISYYAEESDLNKSRSFAAQGQVPERASGGNWQRMYANSQLWTAPLEAGTYSFEVSGRNQGSSEGSLDIAVRLADGTIIATDNQFVVGSANNIVGSFTGIEVPTGAAIAIVNASEYNSNIAIDYVIARKTGDAPADVTAAITSYGYATFASPYALDVTGIDAYYASAVSETSVTLTKAEGTVAPCTGLVLVGTEGEVTIPIAEAGDAIEGNLLVGCLKDTELEASDYLYVLSFNDADKAEFQVLSAMGATIPAGKAYLKIEAPADEESADEGRLAIVFDNTTTGISNVNAMQQQGEVYNLQGQRVEKAVKGLYIVNGKKVLK